MRTREYNQIAGSLRVTTARTHNPHPAAVEPWLNQVDLVVVGGTILCIPKFARDGIERQAKTISNPVRKIFGKIAALSDEGIVTLSASSVTDTQNHACVIRSCAAGKLLQVTIVVEVSDHYIEFAIGTERHSAAVMFGARGHGQIQNQSRVDQDAAVPRIAIHTVCQRRARSIAGGTTLSIIEIDKWCRLKIWMEGNTQNRD